MKRLLMMILVLALAMPCLAETADAGQRVAAPIDAAETAPESTEEAPPVYAEETMPAADEVAPAADEAAPAAEEAAPIEAVMPVEDAEIIAAPVDADVPEVEADLGEVPCVDLEASETVVSSEMLLENASTYIITCRADTHGSVTAFVDDVVVDRAAEGTEITLIAIPETGYALKSFSVTQKINDYENKDLTVTGNTFFMPAGPVTVAASFDVQTNVYVSDWALLKWQLIAGNNVTLKSNVTRNNANEGVITVNNNCYLDLNGYTLDFGKSLPPAIRLLSDLTPNSPNTAKFTIKDSSTGKNGHISAAGYSLNAIILSDYTSLTLQSGNINGFDTAVSMGENSHFTMSGGTISACVTGVSNAADSKDCTFNMTGGTITGCSDGVSLSNTATMTMNGGAITQNVDNGVIIEQSATLSVSGSPVITRGEESWSRGVRLEPGRTITVNGALGTDARIGVSMYTPPGVCVVGTDSYTLTGDDLKHFSSDDSDYTIAMNAEGKGALVKKADPAPNPDPDPDPEKPQTPTTPSTPTTPATPAAPEAPTRIAAAKKNGKATVEVGTAYRLDLGGATGARFKSSNNRVATVDQGGVITPRSAGKAKITFKVGKKKRTVALKVVDPTVPGSVAFSPVDRNVKKGDRVALTPVVPEGTNPGGFKWKSSNKKVARVDGNGVVTFLKRGKVTITATAKRGKKKARVRFRVG